MCLPRSASLAWLALTVALPLSAAAAPQVPAESGAPSRALETAYVLALLGGYLLLWRGKRAWQRRTTGQDPEVFSRATDPLQRFFAGLTRALTVGIVVLIVAHALRLGLPGTSTPPGLDRALFDHLGLGLGVAGLALCRLAQRTLGAAWRVGIDEVRRTELVTTGVYRVIRNPTYLGLFLLNAGLLLVWPTASVALFALAFYLMIEVQVRCEETHLLRLHGEAFREYLRRSWRYLPGLY